MTTRRFYFFLALASVSLTSPCFEPNSATAADYELRDAPGQHMDVLQDGRLVGRYMYALDLASSERRHDTYKPFLHLFDADGDAPITKGPGGQYTHHRGVFRGWSRLALDGKTYDTWHMKGVVQKHLRFIENEADDEHAVISSRISYQTDDGQVLLEETRAMTFLPPPAPAYAMLDVSSTVKAVSGAINLHGDPEHAGLQFRPANEVVGSKTVYHFPGADIDPRKDRDLAWVAESFVIGDDQQFTVIYLNHPENRDGAIFSAYRPYGRFGAWFAGEVPADGEQTTRVRFVVLQGEFPSAEFAQQQYNAFAGTGDPTPELTVRKAK
jgi:hypothetical protein